MCLASHNRGTGAYFSDIHDLDATIKLTTKLGTRKYEVYSTRKISVDDTSDLQNTSYNIITLITCVKNQSDYHILHSMCGANVDYVITHIEREEGFAIASRKLALEKIRRANSRRRYKEGKIVDTKVISVGKGVCTVTFNGYDVMIPQREFGYSVVPDLREVLHPGDERKAVITEYNKDDGIISLSIKQTMPHPFDGIETRHPIGCTRIAKIVGKYGGGVFCRLYDGVTDVLCSYDALQQDSNFKIGDSCEIVINKYNPEKKLVYGKVLRKMLRR